MKYFGTDGFRGEANVNLNVVHAYKVGRFLGWYYGREHKARIIIGKDTRRSSYMFEDALSSGLTASGADVYLEKPFSVKQLYKQIENLLKLRLAFHKQMTDITIGSSSSLSDFAISQKDVEFIDKINAILLEQVVNENYSIETLADQMNMSHSNLYRKMKSLFGMPPNNYVKNFRLNKAAELIANGVRIAEAAERLGFASSSHFAKCFKEKFGMLPKDYK